VNLIALIPAYNAESHLGKVVDKCIRYVDRVLVINDGSSDGTEAKLKVLVRNFKRLSYLSNIQNLGKAESIRLGLRAIVNEEQLPEFFVQLDADLAHSPSDIPGFVSSIKSFDMVVGNRYANRVLDTHRVAAVKAASLLIRNITGYELADPMCGFRLYTGKLGKLFADRLTAHGYGVETEQILISKLAGAKVGQYSLNYIVSQGLSTRIIEFIDILKVASSYADKLSLSVDIRSQLSWLLNSILRRDTFVFSLRDVRVKFVYLANTESYSLEIEQSS
jgi:glycosyltransferase involved in cell wall biosynthesis